MKLSSLSENGGLQALGGLLVLVGVAGVCCWFKGVIPVIIFIGAVLLFFACLIFACAFVMSKGIITPGISEESDRRNAPVISLSENSTVPEFDKIEAKIIDMIPTVDHSYRDTMRRFMLLIEAIDASDPFPDYFVNGIAKKMLYEYKRKYGTLQLDRDHPPKVLLTVEETVRALTPEEKVAFANFCMEKRV